MENRDLNKIKILGILRADRNDTELNTKFGNYYDMFVKLFRQVQPKLEFKIYDVPNGQVPQEEAECDGYIITGSRNGAYDDEPWIRLLEKTILRISKANVPLAGICFGHQILAQAFGGKVEKDNKGWGIGQQYYKNLVKSNNLKDEFKVLAIHQDQVQQTPDDTIVTASSDFCPIAAMRSDLHNFISFQGHPEMSANLLMTILDRRVDDIGAENVAKAKQAIHEANDAVAIAREILDFFAEHHNKNNTDSQNKSAA